MEIEITQLAETDMFAFSHSRAEGGQNAGSDTWNAALQGPRPLLKSPEEIQHFKDWCKDFGAWDDETRAAWSDNEVQALFLQFIAGDVREAGADDLESIDWAEYEQDSQAGRISGNLYHQDGKYYFSLSR